MVSPRQQQGNYIPKKGKSSTCVDDGDEDRRWNEFEDVVETEKPSRFLKQVSFDPKLLRTSDRRRHGDEWYTNSANNNVRSNYKYYELFKTKSTKVLEKQFSRQVLQAVLQEPPHQKEEQQQLVAELIDINGSAVNQLQSTTSGIRSRDGNQQNYYYCSCRQKDHEYSDSDGTKIVLPAAGRYFDALQGPELEILKDSEEELLLPMGKTWPFLLRFPIACFGICLGLGSQAMLWEAISTATSMAPLINRLRLLQKLHLPMITVAIWCVALAALLAISATYALKSFFYFEAVRREFHHPVRVNFFFAPWIASMFLAMGAPEEVCRIVGIRSGGRVEGGLHPYVWCALATPLLLLELKIYGQWLSGGRRRLSKVANPSTHLSLVGNFVSSLLAARVGWLQPAIFFFGVGAAHYLVLFVTLYQRLPTAEALPKDLHPVFFLFVAVPSTASVAWKFIAGGAFDDASKLLLFVALFLYASLVVRIKFFCGFRFSIAWWAYTFPMTASAIATIHYSMEVVHPFTQALAILLSGLSSLTVILLFVSTVLHFICGSLFPNDIAIAITSSKKHNKNPKQVEENSKKLSVSMPSLA